MDERIAARKPQSLSFAETAALPLTAITAWELLFDRLGVPYGVKTEDDALLIINGAGGVGSILNQIAALVDADVLKTTLKEEFGSINAANLRRAHAAQESGHSIGKSVLTGFQPSQMATSVRRLCAVSSRKAPPCVGWGGLQPLP